MENQSCASNGFTNGVLNSYNIKYKKISYKKQIKSEDFERSADMPDGVEADLFAFFFLPLFHIEVRGKMYFSPGLISLCNFMLQFGHAHS